MTAPWPLLARWALALLALALYAGLCLAVWWRERRRIQRQRAEADRLAAAPAGEAPVLVAYASQTGQAEDLARETARQLHTAGQPVRLCALDEVDAALLAGTPLALFVVSTYGEGDAPDNAAAFQQQCMAQGLPLAGLRFGLLALGDSGYAHYCGFGRRLHHWLQAEGGAQPLFDPIEMDSGDPAALAAWQRQLAQVASIDAGQAWHRPEFQPWTLVARAHLNPGSAGGAVHHLELAPPPGATPDWQAGDLAAVRVPADPEHPRDYSIASIPADGRVHLMVRESWRADGSPGAASSWLCHGLVVGAQLDLRLRAHANFRAGGNAQRPWVLIGNGTGLAGLRSHLRARAAGPRHATGGDWLVYGERHAAHDRPYQAELQAWLHDGVLARLDLVFSRDSAERAYVQDRLRAHADVLRHWVRERGAALYVCGSLNGMAQGVDEALRDLLGSAEVDALARAGRYRRDVY